MLFYYQHQSPLAGLVVFSLWVPANMISNTPVYERKLKRVLMNEPTAMLTVFAALLQYYTQ